MPFITPRHGNLDGRGVGDIDTLTVSEYRALSPWRKFLYRLYRHPLVMFGIGPTLLFVVQQRFPLTMLRGADWRSWASVMGTNVAIVVLGAVLIWLIGVQDFLLVQLPIIAVASSVGVWLFYIQHQFEETFWGKRGRCGMCTRRRFTAVRTTTCRAFLPWLTANIGVHHVHHLYARIPFYRLPQVLRDFPELAEVRRITLDRKLQVREAEAVGREQAPPGLVRGGRRPRLRSGLGVSYRRPQ